MRKHRYNFQLLALTLIVLPAIGLYYIAASGNQIWVWGLLSLVILGNGLMVMIP